MADDGATDDELSGTTLDQLIAEHGDSSCGSPTCKIDAAHHFISETKKEEDPWSEVRALHVHASMLQERLDEQDRQEVSTRVWYSSILFNLVNRLGGIVFTPTLREISRIPGRLHIENYNEGGFVLSIVPDAPESDESHAKRKRLN